MTKLDFIGMCDPLTRLKSMGLMPEFVWGICTITKGVVDDRDLSVTPTAVGCSLLDYDLLVVPGGQGTRTLQHDERFINWL
jgi:putative intracellular protease/amidase